MSSPARWLSLASARRHLPFIATLLLVVGVIVVAVNYNAERFRQKAVDFRTTLLATQARFLEDHFTQSLSVVDSILGALLSSNTVGWSAQGLSAHLREETRRMPMLRSLSLLDAQGVVLASSNAANLGATIRWNGVLPRAADSAQVPNFLQFAAAWRGRDLADAVPMDDADAGAAATPYLIPALRTLQVDGKTLYALAAINPDYFVNHYARVLQEHKVRADARVLRLDGALLLSTDESDRVGQLRYDPALLRAQTDEAFGAYDGPDAQGVEQLTAFRVSRHFPMVLVVQVPQSVALQEWREERGRVMWVIGGVLLAGCLVSILVYGLLVQHRAAGVQAKAQALERQRLQTVLEALPATVLLLDMQGKRVVANAGWLAFIEACHITPAQPDAGATWASVLQALPLVEEGDRAVLGDGMRALLQASTPQFDAEYGVRTAQGERWVHLIARPLSSAQLPGVIVVQVDTTDRHQANLALQAFNRDFEAFLAHTSDWVYYKDRDGRLRFCSQTLARTTGHGHWRDMLGKRDRDLFPEALAAANETLEQAIYATGEPLLHHIEAFTNEQGESGHVQTSKWPLFDADRQVVGIFGISRDVTQQQRQQARLQMAATVFTHAREGIVITDAAGTIIDVNESFTRITGYSHAEAVGHNPRFLQSGMQTPADYESMWNALSTQGHWVGELWNRRKDGEIIAVMETISAVRDSQGVTQYYVALCSDITALKQHERQLERIAHFDALTGLPNRVLLADRLQHALVQCQRREQSTGVVFVDLDGFKQINDVHGHAVGDSLLVQIAQRLKVALRDGDTLARIGGDEFVAILADLDQPGDSHQILDRMLKAVALPVTVGEQVLQVSASIGCTLFPQDSSDADLLLRHADQAMYVAKQHGKNRYQLFDVQHDARIQTHRDSLLRIGQALQARELVLYYQPKVNTRTGALVGAEALIRWRHPQRGLLAPAAFLPMIEHHELAVEVGDWVLETAIEQVLQWRAEGLEIPVSVNVAARQLQHGFVERLGACLERHPQFPTHLLELELLESSALDDIEHVAAIVDACSQRGIRFALDDFGTGYSSLSYLKRLPAATIKIDQSFVLDMLHDNDDRAIVEGVIGLANAFRRDVIAEGVETAAHGGVLLGLGCEVVQGYGIAKPMPAEEFGPWVRQQGDRVQWRA